jgi:serine/threonine protein kinase
VPLEPGRRLGPYEVVAQIGAGGMGEVYRARDTRLDRTVALKILPQHATTAEAKERFEREARAISSLNHPNICTLFDVGSDDGVAYLVMELVDGETLASRLAKGALPLDVALKYGASIADALAKAHRHGIVHRDLKPANVMLTKSGAKLLDFGLARRAAETATHDAPTVIGANPITSAGMIVGTLQYMPPEQLEGKPTDARSDIFAFGAVLYEMITGRRAFDAESQASLITKIMSQQPVPIATLQPVTPPGLERLITKCLEKDPEDRWQSAADVASELRWLGDGGATPHRAIAPRRALLPWIAAALATVAAIAAIAMLLRKPSAKPATIHAYLSLPPGMSFSLPFHSKSLAVSPDGSAVVFLAGDELTRGLRLFDFRRGTSRAIEGTVGAASPFWSPDSRSLAFFAGTKLKTLALDEDRGLQTVADLGPTPASYHTGAWMHDGSIVISTIVDPKIQIVASSGGTTRTLLTLPTGAVGATALAPIGATGRFFFNLVRGGTTDVFIGSIDGSAPRRLLSEAGGYAYAAPYVTFVQEGTLFAQRLDEEKLALAGKPVAIANDVCFYRPLSVTQHSVGGDMLVYAAADREMSFVRIDESGARHAIGALSPGTFNELRVSPTGKRLALISVDPHTGVGDLWIAELQRNGISRFTFGERDVHTPTWSADERSLIFNASMTGSPPRLFTRPLSGGTERPLTRGGSLEAPSDALRDGRVLFDRQGPMRSDILLTRSDGDAELWLQTPSNEGNAHVSRDGKWVAYNSDDSGRFEIYVAPFDHSSERIRISANGGFSPAWSFDQRWIYYSNGRNIERAAVHVAGASITSDPPVTFAEVGTTFFSFDALPDGSVLLGQRTVSPQLLPFNVISGWQHEIERQLAKSASAPATE